MSEAASASQNAEGRVHSSIGSHSRSELSSPRDEQCPRVCQGIVGGLGISHDARGSFHSINISKKLHSTVVAEQLGMSQYTDYPQQFHLSDEQGMWVCEGVVSGLAVSHDAEGSIDSSLGIIRSSHAVLVAEQLRQVTQPSDKLLLV